MAANTSIEWTDRTWNPVRGCTRVSPGCGGPGPFGGCYAERMAARFSGPGKPYEGLVTTKGGKPRWTGKITFGHDLDAPLRWRKPQRIFVNSMSDLFHEGVPDAEIDKIFAVMALCPQHTFQVLTKRSARMRAYLSTARAHPVGLSALDVTLHEMARNPRSDVGRGCILQGDICHLKVWPLPNVWLGVSAEDQRRADERVPDLLATPAAVRFVSAEPLLGPVDFTAMDAEHHRGFGEIDALRGIAYAGPSVKGIPRLSWVIVGGESGPGARLFDAAWGQAIVDQCATAGVPCFVKQLGDQPVHTARVTAGGPPITLPLKASRKGNDMAEWPASLRVRQMPALPAKEAADVG